MSKGLNPVPDNYTDYTAGRLRLSGSGLSTKLSYRNTSKMVDNSVCGCMVQTAVRGLAMAGGIGKVRACFGCLLALLHGTRIPNVNQHGPALSTALSLPCVASQSKTVSGLTSLDRGIDRIRIYNASGPNGGTWPVVGRLSMARWAESGWKWMVTTIGCKDPTQCAGPFMQADTRMQMMIRSGRDYAWCAAICSRRWYPSATLMANKRIMIMVRQTAMLPPVLI